MFIRRSRLRAFMLERMIRFQVTISILFMAVILPVLTVILSYSYEENSKNLIKLSNDYIDHARDDSVATARNLLDPVAGTMRIVAEVASANPNYFREEQSRNLLFQVLTSAEQIDAIYTSFEDGYHRVVTRIDADRRRSDPRIPAAANWHSSYIDSFAAGSARQRHRSFFATWPIVIAQYADDTKLDIRTLPHYEAAKRTHALAIADPSINPDTGFPVISLGYPIIAGDKFIGFIGTNITFKILSAYLASHRISPHSTTLIIDQSGRIIAHPVPGQGVRKVNGKLVLATTADLADPAIERAVELHRATNSNRVQFNSDGQQDIGVFGPFPANFRIPWEVLIVAPLDDFIGPLKKTNQRIGLLILALIAAEVPLILVVAKRIARPIEAVTREMQQIQALNFAHTQPQDSFIREIHLLQQAVNLMSNSLRSFAAFVPIGIVRQLVESGRPLTLSGESRFLTIFFSDLENFSTVSEHLPPQQLMRQVSSYFEVVSGALTAESATIDKYIGDSVMAFWGAPSPVEDHIYHACVGALRAAYRVRRLNEQWARDGLPQMRMRVGLHCDNVVVGNVGSADRLSYTIMGDGVNVAARLEGLNKTFHTAICISDSVYNAVIDRIIARELQLVSVKGRQSKIMVYELIGIRNSTDPELSAELEQVA